ncbi:unnamed protein product [Cladocopium goreaui]|uniref:Uncharacterized protein n=1 Tax=Cladocopium goreaui TaxID=2562237 RepID=A0A9P1C131_9DINO|nr:unnamed protein product [Cladocopium goreaui]
MCEFHGRWRRLWHQALSEKEALKDKLQAMGEVIIGWVQIGIWNIFQRTRVWEGKGLVLTLGGGDAIPCTASWKAAASSSRAKQDSESDSKIKAQEAKIEVTWAEGMAIGELQKKLEETQDQLDQAQGDLEQEQLDAAEALVSAGEDLNQLEQRTDSQNRHLEAQLAEMVEFNASAEETVDLLTQELEELKASTAEQLAESENRRKELEFHLEDTEQRLARAQDDLSQRSLDAAEALTELGEELAKAQAQSQASEAELFRLRSLLEDTSETSEPLGPLLILPEDRMLSPKSVAATIHTSEGSPSP